MASLYRLVPCLPGNIIININNIKEQKIDVESNVGRNCQKNLRFYT